MFQQFINREEELAFLERHYRSKNSEFIIIYGRRRIGKTELVSRFIRGKPAIYLLATYKPIFEIIRELQLKMANFTSDPSFIKLRIKHFDELFEEFFKHYKGQKDKIVICIDEFPLLIQRDRGMPSIFQKVWDETLQDKNIMLILMGSSVSMMETEVLGYKSPLYGRRTGQWLVDEFKIFELKQYFARYTNEDIVRVYGILGGIPGYITKFDPMKSIEENLKDKVFRKGEFLYEEPEILMREELRTPSNYFSILRAIASGHNTFGEIVNDTSLDKSLISKYLSVLQNLKIVQRELSVFSSYKKRIGIKRGLYKISDNFFWFWFNYVYPYKSELESNNISFVIEKFNKSFNSYMGRIFEELIRKNYIARKIIPFRYTDLGKWWHKDKEIDLIAASRDENKILFLEIKWSSITKRDSLRIIKNLKEKARAVNWKKESRMEYYGLVALGIENKEELKDHGFIIYSLDDIFSISKT